MKFKSSGEIVFIISSALPFALNVSCVGQEKIRKKSQKGWSKKFNRPIYHSDDSDSNDKLPRAKAIRKYRDDGNEEYFLERLE